MKSSQAKVALLYAVGRVESNTHAPGRLVRGSRKSGTPA